MKTFVPFFILFALSLNTGAQLLSRFTWENNPVTNAVQGLNAVSASAYATVSANGINGTKGLNPGNGSNDINLVLDGAPYNVPALDISIDFRREESQASFFYRGAYFNFGMNGGSLGVNFKLSSGLSSITINSGNIYNIPDDHKFHNYHFNYDDNTGSARVWVDAALVYTYKGIAGTPLYWAGAGNVTIGKDMDATGKNIAVLDNLFIQKYASALLPLSLMSFTADAKNKYAVINWNTTEELQVSSYVLERSNNGAGFSPIKIIPAARNYNSINRYQFTDSLPPSPTAFYRLKILNDNGSFVYSEIKSVGFDVVAAAEISLFPNPATASVIIKMNNARAGKFRCSVLSITGMPIITTDMELNTGMQQIKIDLTKTSVKGAMIVQVSNMQTHITETFTIIKK